MEAAIIDGVDGVVVFGYAIEFLYITMLFIVIDENEKRKTSMEQKKIKGIIPIMQAAFTEDGVAVDYEDMAHMSDATIRDGAGGIVLFGFGTEFYKLSDDEKTEMVSVCVKAVSGRVPVIANITAGSTEVAVKTAQLYESLGVDAIMILSPSIVAPSTRQLIEHILSIGNSVNLLSIIQYAPTMGGGALTPDAVKEICEKSRNNVYIKAEPIPTAPFIDGIRKLVGNKIGLFSGNMGLHMIDLMDRGVIGFMPGCSLVPIYNEAYKAYMIDNDRKRAEEIFNAMIPIIMIINQNVEILVKYEKMLLVKRGIIKNSYCRKPTAFDMDQKFWDMFFEYRERLRDITFVGDDYSW